MSTFLTQSVPEEKAEKAEKAVAISGGGGNVTSHAARHDKGDTQGLVATRMQLQLQDAGPTQVLTLHDFFAAPGPLTTAAPARSRRCFYNANTRLWCAAFVCHLPSICRLCP